MSGAGMRHGLQMAIFLCPHVLESREREQALVRLCIRALTPFVRAPPSRLPKAHHQPLASSCMESSRFCCQPSVLQLWCCLVLQHSELVGAAANFSLAHKAVTTPLPKTLCHMSGSSSGWSHLCP